MKPMRSHSRFEMWSRIPGQEKPGLLGRRFARLWPIHEHRRVDVRILRRSGIEHGFEGLVVGLTADAASGVLSGLMVREQECSRMTASYELPLDRLLGLRDPVYQKLMLGTHASIDVAIVRSLARAAMNSESSRRISCLCALAKFVDRRDLPVRQVKTLLDELDAGVLAEDPTLGSRASVA